MAPESQRRRRQFKPVRAGACRLHLEPLEDRTMLSSSLPLGPVNWTSLGPAPEVGPGALAVSGRVDGIATDPTNPNIIYVATASGGVWKTTNSGVTWSALTDDQSTLFMGAIALAPSDPNVIYAGTGDANLGPSKLAFNRDNIYYGLGVLKSTDAGATWTLETGNSAQGNNVFDRRTISKIVVDPTDLNTVYVAVGAVATNGLPGNTGIWKSTDGGQNWTDTTAAISTTAAFSDLVIDPTNPQVLYAGVGAPAGDPANGVYKTTNGGATWAVAGDLPTGATDPRIGRVTLALAPSDPDILYVALIASGLNPEPGLYAQSSLYKFETTQDAGVTWTNLPNTPQYLGQYLDAADTIPAFFGDYDTALAVDPTNAMVVYAAGTQGHFVETTDGGKTAQNWTDLFYGTNTNNDVLTGVPGDDEHSIVFDSTGRFLVGNDEGIFRQTNPGSDPTTQFVDDINGNLDTDQLAGIAIDPNNPDIAYGGAQDNGDSRFDDSSLNQPYLNQPVQSVSWNEVNGFKDITSLSDGGFIQIDPFNTSTVYEEAFYVPVDAAGQAVFFLRSDDNGLTWTPRITGLNLSEPGNFFVPFVVDPAHPGRLLLGTSQVYESTNNGDNWLPLGSFVFPDIIDAVAAAPSDVNTVYATARGGHVFVTTDHGTNWVERDPVTPNTQLRYRGLFVDPRNANIAYVVASNFDNVTGGGQVWRTTNAGVSWTNISGNLPDIPFWSIAVDTYGTSQANDVYYIGTDAGVYSSSNQGATWARLGVGLPNVQVQNLAISENLGILAAGTFGRGLWELAIPAAAAPPTVTGLQRFGVHVEPTTLVLTFSQAMDASSADTLANYTLVAQGHGRGRVIRLVVANYDAAAQTVTLVPSQVLNLHRVYRLTVNGTVPLGLTNTSGFLLDGNGDGKPGGNYVAILRGFGLDKSGVPFNKLIREQLGGKPVSSRRVQYQLSKSLLRLNHPRSALQAPQHLLTVPTPHGPLPALRTRRHPSEGS
jgi:photosystem II stability/assembly factor-like uncharacterized protein